MAQVKHKHGTPKGNAQVEGGVDVIGPGDLPANADIVSRGAGHAAGLAGRDGEHRRQEADVNAGKRTDRRGGTYHDSTDRRKRK